MRAAFLAAAERFAAPLFFRLLALSDVTSDLRGAQQPAPAQRHGLMALVFHLVFTRPTAVSGMPTIAASGRKRLIFRTSQMVGGVRGFASNDGKGHDLICARLGPCWAFPRCFALLKRMD